MVQRDRPNYSINCFTNSSLICSSGAGIWRKDRLNEGILIPLGKYNTVFQSEVAIFSCGSELLIKNKKGNRITICNAQCIYYNAAIRVLSNYSEIKGGM